jgi:hypothetical protein
LAAARTSGARVHHGCNRASARRGTTTETRVSDYRRFRPSLGAIPEADDLRRARNAFPLANTAPDTDRTAETLLVRGGVEAPEAGVRRSVRTGENRPTDRTVGFRGAVSARRRRSSDPSRRSAVNRRTWVAFTGAGPFGGMNRTGRDGAPKLTPIRARGRRAYRRRDCAAELESDPEPGATAGPRARHAKGRL